MALTLSVNLDQASLADLEALVSTARRLAGTGHPSGTDVTEPELVLEGSTLSVTVEPTASSAPDAHAGSGANLAPHSAPAARMGQRLGEYLSTAETTAGAVVDEVSERFFQALDDYNARKQHASSPESSPESSREASSEATPGTSSGTGSGDSDDLEPNAESNAENNAERNGEQAPDEHAPDEHAADEYVERGFHYRMPRTRYGASRGFGDGGWDDGASASSFAYAGESAVRSVMDFLLGLDSARYNRGPRNFGRDNTY